MKVSVAFIAVSVAFVVPASAQTPAPLGPASRPFTTTLSNTTPLVFGMTLDAATAALGTPLVYVEGRPGSEVFLTIRNVSGNFYSFRQDPLFLQFRDGRLTGWKADWSRNWMWK